MLGEVGVEAAGACLYQVVVQGVRFSATCDHGHRLVMEMLERFHLLEAAQVAPEPSPAPAVMARIAELFASATAAATTSADASAPPTAATPTPDANTLPASAEPTLFSEFRDLYLTNLARNRKHPKASGYRQQVYVLQLVEDLVGDKPLHRITVDDANSVARALEVWPAYLHNLPDYKDIPARSVVAKAQKEHPQPLQKGTQRKHILCINAFFHWCMELNAIDKNPFRVVQLTRYKEAVPRKKSPFSAQDLRALFDPVRQLAHAEPHKYWVPMIAMYSGMRVNEISQLHVADIKSEDVMDEADHVHRIYYFDVTPFRKGQHLKTKHSCRRVPIHSKLIDAGFLCYLDEVRASGAAHLFPGLPWKEGGPGRAITRWFNRDHLRKLCGITDRLKTFHCFRHTLTSLAERCGIPTSIRRTINGHADGRGIDEARYIARGSLLECKQALEKLLFPELDVVPYAPGRFEPYLSGVAAPKACQRRPSQYKIKTL